MTKSPCRRAESGSGGGYHRNLMALTGVPTINLIWVIKLSFSAPTRRRLAP